MGELTAGTLVTPSVRLVRELGAGGMGSVWLADHLTLKTQVVVKFIADALSKDALNVARFSREAAAASQVKSPHVVQMFDHGVDDSGVPFIVMEYLEGRDLAAHLAEHEKLPAAEVVAIVHQVAKALSRAHERGIVHRDVKPENIFLCDVGGGESFVKVLDFGIARGGEHLAAATTTGAMMGTPFYMSPEQMVGSKDIDHRADLWALAVVTFQMLTGTRPFEAETIGALAIAIHSGKLPVPTSLDPTLPRAFDEWFGKACARDLTTRFQTAKDLAASLSVALGVRTESMPGSLDGDRSGGHAPAKRPASGNVRNDLALDKTQAAGSEVIPTSSTHAATSVGVDTMSQRRAGSGRALVIVGVFAGLALLGGGALLLTQSGERSRGTSASAATSSSLAAPSTTSTATQETKGAATIAVTAATASAMGVATNTAAPSVTASSPPSSTSSPSSISSVTKSGKVPVVGPSKSVVGKPSTSTAPPRPSSGYDDIQ